MKKISIEISPTSILLVLGIILGLIIAWSIRGIILMLFTAFILNAAFRPYVGALEKRRVPRMLSIFLIYVLFIGIVTFAVVSIATETIPQLQNLLARLPDIIPAAFKLVTNTFPWLNNVLDAASIRQSAINLITGAQTEVITGAFGILNSLLSVFIEIITVLVISIYMLQRKENFYDGLVLLFPKERRQMLTDLIVKIEDKLGAWLRGQFILMLTVGIFTWLGLTIPSLFFKDYQLNQFAFPIALFAGILEAVPNLGPFLTAVFGVIIAAGTSPVSVVVYVLVLFILIQQVENIFLVPTIMKRAVGVDPIVVIIAIIVAVDLLGIVGALLVVPMVAVIQIVIEYTVDKTISPQDQLPIFPQKTK